MATLRLPVATRDALAGVFLQLIDAAGTPGSVSLYGGVQPSDAASGVTDQTCFAEIALAYPAADAPQSGILGFFAPADVPSALETGEVTWARFRDGDGNTVWDGSVTEIGRGGMVEMNTTKVVKDGPVRLSNWSIVIPGG